MTDHITPAVIILCLGFAQLGRLKMLFLSEKSTGLLSRHSCTVIIAFIMLISQIKITLTDALLPMQLLQHRTGSKLSKYWFISSFSLYFESNNFLLIYSWLEIVFLLNTDLRGSYIFLGVDLSLVYSSWSSAIWFVEVVLQRSFFFKCCYIFWPFPTDVSRYFSKNIFSSYWTKITSTLNFPNLNHQTVCTVFQWNIWLHLFWLQNLLLFFNSGSDSVVITKLYLDNKIKHMT